MEANGWPLRVRNSFTRSVPAQWADPTQHDISQPVRNQLHAAEDERPHDDLAELAVGLHERQQAFAIELDHFAGLDRPCPHERAAAGEHVGFAGELARSVCDDHCVSSPCRWPDDFHLTFRDHEKRDDGLTDVEEHLAARDTAGRARAEPRGRSAPP